MEEEEERTTWLKRELQKDAQLFNNAKTFKKRCLGIGDAVDGRLSAIATGAPK